MYSYNTIVNYNLNEELVFEDFSLTLIQDRSVPGPNNAKWQMNALHFKISGKSGIKTIIWSSGTGRIKPTKFTYNEKEFLLILKTLVTTKPGESFSYIELQKNELVIQKTSK
ncbi:hypothetical protein [Psychroserpens damuponensis]|uniref:hypothetical protein n=1 Tax=Psychroserpens damuponensis TaxID=943936 RepID=UPI0012699994|nr:hypothetical protein [Psychroserpens damuponensis]